MVTPAAPKLVILHCADTPDYPADLPGFDRFGAADIKEWHLARGFLDIGYHYVVRRSGVIEPGRPEGTPGAHCEGHNEGSLGVCYVGNHLPTIAQLRSILWLSRDFKERFGLTPEDWYGHQDFNPQKTCPGIVTPLIRAFLHHDVTP